jgi:glycosyltransferase involved in cell wall biosynthesis
MAQGVPIVTTVPVVAAWAGLPEPRDGETMLFVGCNDPAALADATRRIVGDESLATRLRVGARACAAQFTWPGIARQHIALYEAIASPAPRCASVSVPASEGERSWR